jgi:hypothetical protein
MKNLSITLVLSLFLSYSLFSQNLDVDGPITLGHLSGTGIRMVTADASGQLNTQAITSGLWLENGSHIHYSTGNVGIGVTSPAANLAVGGNGAYYEAIYGETNLVGGTAVSGSATATTGVSDGGLFISNSPNGRAVYASNYAVNGFDFYAGSSDSRNYFAGKVGIGTQNPASQLAVGGDGVYFATISGQSTENTGVYGESTNGSGIYGYSANSSGVYGKSPNSSGVYGESTEGSGVYGTSTNTTGVYGESTNSNGIYGYAPNGIGVAAQGGDYDFYAESPLGQSFFAGKVGIGVLYPYSNLSIGGSGYSRVSVYSETDRMDGIGIVGVSKDTLGAGGGGYFQSYSTGGYGVYAINESSGGWDVFAASPSSANYFAGRVGIGTYNPVSSLHINDETGPTGMLMQGFANLDLGILFESFTNRLLISEIYDPGGSSTISSGVRFDFFDDVVEPTIDNDLSLGSDSYKWTEVWSVNGTIQTSDIRSKDDVQSLSYGLAEIMHIEPISYRWRDSDDQDMHIGFSAQNMETIIPEIVVQPRWDQHAAKDRKGDVNTGNMKGLKYAEMIPVLVKAIQEQQAIIQKLEARLDALEK